MIDFIKTRLRRVSVRFQQVQLLRWLAFCWLAFAGVGGLVIAVAAAWGHLPPITVAVLGGVAGGVAVVLAVRCLERRPTDRWTAQQIENAHPELAGSLLTAVQQANAGQGAPANFLQDRLLRSVVEQCQRVDWQQVVPRSRLWLAHGGHLAALGVFVGALWLVGSRVAQPVTGEGTVELVDGVSVTPGDAEIERGQSLVVLARFGDIPPASVQMIVTENGAAPRRVPLVRGLADPVFGGTLPEVANGFTYRLEYGTTRTRDFKVTVFEHPKLERADADLTFPGYTGLAPKRIEDTRRLSAVEGTQLDLALQLNKPVKSAQLAPRDGKSAPLDLKVTEGKALVSLPRMTLAQSQAYELKLVDAEGRTNKVATSFVIDVQPNRAPELRLASPRGDVRPSAIEEIAFSGTTWDDFGTRAYGLGYTLAGGETVELELGREVPAKEKREFNHLLRLESLGMQPEQLISYFLWAEDLGPDGQPRRTRSDLYFAEVRPFDEIFREDQGMGEQEQGGQGEGGGGETRKLAELQKQIINATWKLQRAPTAAGYAEDAGVVRSSQEQAAGQAGEALQKANDPAQRTRWAAVKEHMDEATRKLAEAPGSPTALGPALTAEQAAYQALLKLNARETSVTRSRKGGGGGGGESASQRQLDGLDLAQSDNRYETQRQAKAPENNERREQLQVMNRLQELARRQQDFNERLQELQTALQEAKTEAEREEIKRRLKRLQEDQQQMLADVDELKQRMDRPENQSSMSEERQQLEQTREDVQRAADAAAGGSVPQALAAGTRAQRQLQQLRDDLRKENSSEFADELRDLRNEARDLARAQDDVRTQLAESGQNTNKRKTLDDSADQQGLIDQLTKQEERMKALVQSATQLSDQAENSEPLLARQLYDSLRKVAQDDAQASKQLQQELMKEGLMTRALYDRLQQQPEGETGRALALTSEMLRAGYLPQAGEVEKRARAGIDELKRGVERAAESVLGDDAAALELAQSELDRLTEQLQREAAQAAGGAPGRGGKGGQPGDAKEKGGQLAQGGRGEKQDSPSGEPMSGEATENGREEAPDGPAGLGPGRSSLAQNERSGQKGGGQGDPSQKGAGGAGGQQEGQESMPGGQPQGPSGGETETPAGSAMAGGPSEGQGGGRGSGAQREAGGERQSGRGMALDERLLGEENGEPNGTSAGNGPIRGQYTGGPLTGDSFGGWADRLRDVEEMIEDPALRSAVSTARERARLLRRDFRQDRKKPDWAVVNLEIVQPLVQVRARIAEDLARRDSREALVPIDRDPVPPKYAEMVRRYYEELGKQ